MYVLSLYLPWGISLCSAGYPETHYVEQVGLRSARIKSILGLRHEALHQASNM